MLRQAASRVIVLRLGKLHDLAGGPVRASAALLLTKREFAATAPARFWSWFSKDDDSRAPKPKASEEAPPLPLLTVYVPKGQHVALIGKSGSVVKELQTKHKTKVTIPNRDDPSSAILIEGEETAVKECRSAIEQILGVPVSTEPLARVQINVPKEKHGLIIGPRGATIREIESKFAVAVTMPQQGQATSTEVTLEGAAAGTEAAVAHIEKLVGVSLSSKSAALAPTPKLDLTSRPIAVSLFFPEPAGQSQNLDRLLQHIQAATKTLDICVFSISNDKLATAVVLAHQQGIAIRLITDNDTSVASGSDIKRFREVGIAVRMDSTPAHMHHKFCIVDGVLLINGSFNWSRQATVANHENIMITNSRDFVIPFAGEFESLWKQFAPAQ